MGIWFYEVWNNGENRSVVKYGLQPNRRGPTRSGFSEIYPDDGEVPDWCIGASHDPLLIETGKNGTVFSWRIYDERWALHVHVAVNGGYIRWLGDIRILYNYARFHVWLHDDRIVIGNFDKKLGRASDGRSFQFYAVTTERIAESNNSAVLT